MRYVEVTHTYVVPVPSEQEEGLDTVVNFGVSSIEEMLKSQLKAIIDVRSDWKLMPKEYRPSQPVRQKLTFERATPQGIFDAVRENEAARAREAIENDTDEGITLTGGMNAGVKHPWEQGLRILPLEHPGAPAETAALVQEGILCGEIQTETQMICVGVEGHPPGQHLWVEMEGPHGNIAESGGVGDDRSGRPVEGSPGLLEAGDDGDSGA